MVIKPMKPEHSHDWFDFFDNRAFSDHEAWKGCYCTGLFMPKPAEYQNAGRKRKEYASWLVANGWMKGYLAYEHGQVVAWCNVNDKNAFSGLKDIQTDEGGVVAVVCFIVQKEYRGKGIAQKLLDRIIDDAKKSGKKIIEAYPRRNARTEYGNYHGTHSMYEKNGFVSEKVRDVKVLRRYL